MSESLASSVSDQQQLVSDMKSAIADAEDILHDTSDQAGDKVAGMRVRIQERLRAARIRLASAEETLLVNTRVAARATDAYVHESPWVAIGIAAGVGLLAGLILGRR